MPDRVVLKVPAEFKLIGTSVKRLDTPSKVDGSAVFGIDIAMPGMKIGTLAISPVKGGTIAGIDEAAARRVPGVRDIVRVNNEAVAVIGDHMWAAKQGLEALDLVWEAGQNRAVSSATLNTSMAQASEQQQGAVARKDGNAQGAIAVAATRISAVYQSPFLSHAPMEPLNCTLHIQPDRAEVWVGTQVPVRAQASVMAATGLPAEKVMIHNQLMGGAFGRRLEVDSIELAALIARQFRYPVKLVWTREEDMRHDYYRPYYYDRVSAGLDAQGRLTGRTHRVTGSSIYARWAPAGFKNSLDPDAVDCAAETPYEIPAEYVDYVCHEPPGVNTSWWRGVGPTHNLFVVESFIDELATAANRTLWRSAGRCCSGTSVCWRCAIQLAHAGRKGSSHVPWQAAARSHRSMAVGSQTRRPLWTMGRVRSGQPHSTGQDCLASAPRSPQPPDGLGRWGSTPSRSTGHTAICCTSSCRPSPTRGPTSTAARSATGRASIESFRGGT